MPSGTCGYQSRRGKDAYRCRYHPLLLLRPQLREHGERYDLDRHFFRSGEVTTLVAQILVSLLQMERDRIVDGRADVCLGQLAHEAVAALNADHVEMVDGSGPVGLVGWPAS